MINLLSIYVVCGTSLWVLIDARNIGMKKGATKGFFDMGPVGWFIACLLCWIAVFPLYLVKRRQHLRAAAVHEQAGAADDTDFVSQLGALTQRSAQGLVTEEDFRTKRLALVSRVMEQASDADLISQLGTLADLSTQDFLTDEEFQTRKRALVHRMMEQPDDDVALAGN